MNIRVVVADDQDLVREGISVLLSRQEGIEVVGQARNGREALDQALKLQPDVVLMDVRMPEMDGVEATRRLTSDTFLANPDSPIKVLILTTYNVGSAVKEALRNGASGFALKDRASADLVTAVRAIAAGDAWLDPAVTLELINEVRAAPVIGKVSGDRLPQLTPRETETLALIGQGLSNQEIAAYFVISEATVKTHFGRILMKMGLRDRAQAVVAAYESGLVKPSNTR